MTLSILGASAAVKAVPLLSQHAVLKFVSGIADPVYKAQYKYDKVPGSPFLWIFTRNPGTGPETPNIDAREGRADCRNAV